LVPHTRGDRCRAGAPAGRYAPACFCSQSLSESLSRAARRSWMRAIRRGERGAAVAEIRSILVVLDLLVEDPMTLADPAFDEATEQAVRVFQQSRGLTMDGTVGDETWRALDAARWRLGQRVLYRTVADP